MFFTSHLLSRFTKTLHKRWSENIALDRRESFSVIQELAQYEKVHVLVDLYYTWDLSGTLALYIIPHNNMVIVMKLNSLPYSELDLSLKYRR